MTVSFVGDGIYIIAIAWQTYDLSNSPSALAAVGVAWSLPQVVLLLASGVLSDRLDRRHLMIAGDAVRGVAVVAETCITMLVVIWVTLVQRLVPSELLGRVSSVDWMISIAGVPLSFAVVGPAADAFGVDATLIAAGVLGAAIVFAFMFYPGARDPERDGSVEAIREAEAVPAV
jgi:MFS family permease